MKIQKLRTTPYCLVYQESKLVEQHSHCFNRMQPHASQEPLRSTSIKISRHNVHLMALSLTTAVHKQKRFEMGQESCSNYPEDDCKTNTAPSIISEAQIDDIHLHGWPTQWRKILWISALGNREYSSKSKNDRDRREPNCTTSRHN